MGAIYRHFIPHTPGQWLILISVGGLILRLLGLVNITLAGDFAYHWQVAGTIVHQGARPLLGPSASVNTSFHLGPFYYYLLAIPYALGGGHFQVAIVFFAVINTLSIPLLYHVSRRWFSNQTSLQITTLYAVSSYMISVQNFPWNPYVLPWLCIAALYCLLQIEQQRWWYLVGLGLVASLMIQAHGTALFLLPVFILLLPRSGVPRRFWFWGASAFLLTLGPWLHYDLITNFSQSRAAIAILAPGPQEPCSFIQYLRYHGHGERCFGQIRNSLFVSRLFTVSLLGTRNLMVVAIGLVGLLGLFSRRQLPQRKLIFFWLGIPWLGFLFYSGNVYLHYFLILTPLPFLVAGMFLEYVAHKGRPGQIANQLVFWGVVGLNLLTYLRSLNTVRG